MLQVLMVKARPLRALGVSALAVLLACALGGAYILGVGRPASAPNAVAPAAPPPPVSAVEREEEAQDARCLQRLVSVRAAPPSHAVAVNRPELRAQLLGRTRATPVLFVAAPEPPADVAVEPLRKELDGPRGNEAFGRIVGKLGERPARARSVFLVDGYLYTEEPRLATLYGSLRLSLLFRDPALRIERGAETFNARRTTDGDYEYTSGPERGKRAKLLLFDRVHAVDAPEKVPLHADLRAVAAELGFDELRVEGLTPREAAVWASYGEVQVPTLLSLSQGRASLACEAPGAARQAMLAHRAQAARALRVQQRLLAVIHEQIDEALPFDEPKTEDGQQDGHLRPEWRRAYLRGNSSYEFNGDKYSVFDRFGRPRPPQVCIDFVLDTFERASGTWWRPRDSTRERVRGRLRFDDLALVNARSVERFIEFAQSQPDWFDVYEPPAEARVPLKNREQFFSALYRTRTHYRVGDVVAILGPRDDERLHYHSFFVVDRDPLSGMPTEVAANAGRPRIRSWEGEMVGAPRRGIVARIRAQKLWLESLIPPPGGVSADAPAESSPARDPVSEAPEPTAG